MFKFKVGDMVKVHRGVSDNSEKLDGLIGTVIQWERDERGEFGNLDIEGDNNSGLWANELELVEAAVKKIKIYPIVKFMEGVK